METEGLRRSGRIRKPVKTYAEEQAEEADETAHKQPPSKRRKKTGAAKQTKDDDGDADFAEPAANDFVTKPVKKTGKKTKLTSRDHDEDVAAGSSKPGKKTKATAPDTTWHASAAESKIAKRQSKVRQLRPGQEEKRLRAYVEEPDAAFERALKRANKERMFVIDRERGTEEDCHANHDDCPCEVVQIAGSTGNLYKVTISHLLSCTCPAGIFAKKKQEKSCKHLVYVLHHVLKAPGELKYQNALLTSELREIFDNAPALPSEIAEDDTKDGKRKPLEDDCPICCMEFEADDEVVWCRAACGNNVHTACFEQWAQTKRSSYATVTCPFCRTAWDAGDGAGKSKVVDVAKIKVPGQTGGGYVNVAHLLDYE